MANSSIIATLKKNVINALCDDPDINVVIDSVKYSGRKLKNTHIFSYNRNPDTITNVMTFITVMVSTNKRDRNGTFVTTTLVINVYTHDDHMNLKNLSIEDFEDYNRNDYLSILIDEKFNNSSDYGTIGKLKLIDNYEYTIGSVFSARRIIFEAVDMNNSLCEQE